jgi:hypothetical protein
MDFSGQCRAQCFVSNQKTTSVSGEINAVRAGNGLPSNESPFNAFVHMHACDAAAAAVDAQKS